MVSFWWFRLNNDTIWQSGLGSTILEGYNTWLVLYFSLSVLLHNYLILIGRSSCMLLKFSLSHECSFDFFSWFILFFFLGQTWTMSDRLWLCYMPAQTWIITICFNTFEACGAVLIFLLLHLFFYKVQRLKVVVIEWNYVLLFGMNTLGDGCLDGCFELLYKIVINVGSRFL